MIDLAEGRKGRSMDGRIPTQTFWWELFLAA